MPARPSATAARPFATAARRLLHVAAFALAGTLSFVPAAFVPAASGQSLREAFGLPDTSRERLSASAALTDADGVPLEAPPAKGETVTLAITARIPDGFYLVGQDSPVGQPMRIRLTDTLGLEPVGDRFTPDREPEHAVDSSLNGVVEKFTVQVTWTRAYTVTGDGPIRVTGELRGTYCQPGRGGICVPVGAGDAPFNASLTADEPASTGVAASEPGVDVPGLDQPGDGAGPFRFAVTPKVRGKDGPVSLTAALPRGAAVGSTIELALTLDVAEGYHVYAMENPGPAATETEFDVTAFGLEPRGDFTPSTPAEAVEHFVGTLREHHGTVTFARSYEVVDAAYGAAGAVSYQACTNNACLRPKTVTFTLGAQPTDEAQPNDAAALAETFVRPETDQSQIALWTALPLAFLGGLILNFMPCVLPVIALKAMSFAKQAGESRSRVLQLNLWYAAGVLSVFLVFAGLALGLGAFLNVDSFGWGDQVNTNAGKIVFTVLVVALGLSMVGLYEIPVPGFVGSAAGAAGHKEGVLGAFLGGVLTTLLATPCTGPLLGAAGGAAVGLAESNPLGSVALWMAMGLGFASPYLVIAFMPGATKFLPRPGDWMVRFKEFGGLLLIGTGLYLLSGVRPYELWLPVLVGLLGLTIGLWIVGRLIRHNDSRSRKYGLRLAALATTLAIGAAATTLGPSDEPAVWEPFDVARLTALRESGRTVIVDFRQAICPSCDVNEAVALDTDTAYDAYRQLDVVPMKGWVDRSADADDLHERLGGFGVPFLAIFPADRPNDPIRHEGLISQADLLALLEQAAGRPYVPGATPPAPDAPETAGIAPDASTVPPVRTAGR